MSTDSTLIESAGTTTHSSLSLSRLDYCWLLLVVLMLLLLLLLLSLLLLLLRLAAHNCAAAASSQDNLSVEQREAWRRSLPGSSRSARIASRIARLPLNFPVVGGAAGFENFAILRGESQGGRNDLEGGSNATVRVIDVARWHGSGWCHPYSKHRAYTHPYSDSEASRYSTRERL